MGLLQWSYFRRFPKKTPKIRKKTPKKKRQKKTPKPLKKTPSKKTPK